MDGLKPAQESLQSCLYYAYIHKHILQTSFPCTGCSSCGWIEASSGITDGPGNASHPTNTNCVWRIFIRSSNYMLASGNFNTLARDTRSSKGALQVFGCHDFACVSIQEVRPNKYLAHSHAAARTVEFSMQYRFAEVRFTSETKAVGSDFTLQWISVSIFPLHPCCNFPFLGFGIGDLQKLKQQNVIYDSLSLSCYNPI